jgi:hypothetical protein
VAKSGSKHDVRLTDTSMDFLQQQLYKDLVAFSFQSADGASSRLITLLPNLVLLLLIGGFMYTSFARPTAATITSRPSRAVRPS